MDSKIVVITGGSRGLGAFLVSHFLLYDYTVITCSRSKLNESNSNKKLHHIITDLSQAENIENLASSIKTIIGENKINLLINNAALPGGNELVDFNYKQFAEIQNVNAHAPLYLSIRLQDFFDTNSSIINIGSGIVSRMITSNIDYIISKSTLEAVTRILSFEFATRGIRVNSIAPSLFNTTFGGINQIIERNYDKIIAETPLRKIIDFNDILQAVQFLIHSQSITGEVIYVDGGRHITG